MTRNSQSAIPVVDIFAGPGGLGEGFSAFTAPGVDRAFRIVLSIEMEEAAHQTLELRSFVREFADDGIPDEYYLHLQGRLSREELFSKFPKQAEAARKIAWKAELGGKGTSSDEVDARIRSVVGASPDWVLCGGPPCQAYSVIGRSRNGGQIDETDHRVYLYREYLRILSEHRPPVFIMENVKGLLSSKVGSDEIFNKLLEDLRQPSAASNQKRGHKTRYVLFPLVREQIEFDFVVPNFDPGDFVIKCEDFGIPQSRHRVIILGLREDIADQQVPALQPLGKQIPASDVLKGLPRLRSGLTHTPDGKTEWRNALGGILKNGWLEGIPNGKGEDLKRDIRWTLSRLREPRADRGGEFIACETATDYEEAWYCDPRIAGVCNHASRPHMVEDLYRYLFAACYARLFDRSPELRDFPPRLLPKHKNVKDKKKKEYFDDRFRVQLPDKPSTTVTCHLSKDGHYFIHFDETQCRSMTVREAARLQTFPDNYVFCGPRTRQYTQVGNAVPPLLARQIAGVAFQVLRGAGVDHNDSRSRSASFARTG